MFGIFKRKPPTALDAFIRLAYGPNPPRKSADLERAVIIAHEDILLERVPLPEIKRTARELFRGPIPYSTHDLAVSTALAFFESPEYAQSLRVCQIPARMQVVNWAKEGKVVGPLAQTFEEVLYRRYKPVQQDNPKQPLTAQESEKLIISLIEKLLTAQLMLRYECVGDAFSALMTNKLAAGYVFGFHDACFQTFGRLDQNSPTADFSIVQTSYKNLFDDARGVALFERSISLQNDADFQIGRLSGGEEYMEFVKLKTTPLGLQRILLLGFDPAAVWRTLAQNRV